MSAPIPEVYRLIIHGSVICNGIIGTANIANVSLATPASISFRPVAESVMAKPICQLEKHKLLTKVHAILRNVHRSIFSCILSTMYCLLVKMVFADIFSH